MTKKEQELYNDWILENIQDGKMEEFKALLQECFKKASEGTQTQEYLIGFSQKMVSLLKPEYERSLGKNG